ncbi:MAG TPA: PAS domain-containing protein, partial [Ferruginibacter sp.]|nr:PAS domain-containing protein [Ferruginibacter sp.]
RLLELEKKLEEQVIIHKDDSERFLLAAKLSFDVIWDWNLLTNEVFLGDGFEELFGYMIKDNKGDMITDWVNYLHPDDVEAVVKELQDCIKSTATGWEHAYRVSRKDGSVAKVFVRASIIRHADGKAYRMIGAIQDLSRQKELEEKLEQEILLKEKQIEDAAEDARETERSDIGKELHDNINQLLGASRMYLEMAKRGGENSALYLSRSSEYTLNAIDEIRNLTKGLTTDIINNIGLGDAIENTVRDLSEVNLVKISSSLESFNEDSVTDKFKHNVFRIIQEQLNNILKHAKAEKIIISLVQNKRSIKLRISDNGIGYDTRKKQKGIGIENIKDRASRYKGNAVFVSQPGRGCVLTVLFPVSDLLLKKTRKPFV